MRPRSLLSPLRMLTNARLTTQGELAAHERARLLRGASPGLTTSERGAFLSELIAEVVSSCIGNFFSVPFMGCCMHHVLSLFYLVGSELGSCA